MATGDGLVSMAPTSITQSGTSASINADGGVDFTAVTSLSLNGVFTSNYDNYLIVYAGICSVNDASVWLRFRAAGTDNTTASSYTTQFFYADNATRAGARTSQNAAQSLIHVSSASEGGSPLYVYGPFLSGATAFRSVPVSGYASGFIQDTAGTHNQTTSYDGITFLTSGGDITGNIHVFGYEE